MRKRVTVPEEVIIGVSLVEYFEITDGEVPLDILNAIHEAEMWADELHGLPY